MEGLILKLKFQYSGYLMWRTDSLEKTLKLGKTEGRRRRGRQRMRWLDSITYSTEHEFEQALGVADGQGSLAWCSPWSHKESDTTEQLKWTELINIKITYKIIFTPFFMLSLWNLMHISYLYLDSAYPSFPVLKSHMWLMVTILNTRSPNHPKWKSYSKAEGWIMYSVYNKYAINIYWMDKWTKWVK